MGPIEFAIIVAGIVAVFVLVGCGPAAERWLRRRREAREEERFIRDIREGRGRK